MAQDKSNKRDESHVSGQSNTSLSQTAHCLSTQQVADELKVDTLNALSVDDAETAVSLNMESMTLVTLLASLPFRSSSPKLPMQ